MKLQNPAGETLHLQRQVNLLCVVLEEGDFSLCPHWHGHSKTSKCWTVSCFCWDSELRTARPSPPPRPCSSPTRGWAPAPWRHRRLSRTTGTRRWGGRPAARSLDTGQDNNPRWGRWSDSKIHENEMEKKQWLLSHVSAEVKVVLVTAEKSRKWEFDRWNESCGERAEWWMRWQRGAEIWDFSLMKDFK